MATGGGKQPTFRTARKQGTVHPHRCSLHKVLVRYLHVPQLARISHNFLGGPDYAVWRHPRYLDQCGAMNFNTTSSDWASPGQRQ